MMKTVKRTMANNKGFTLVELIVVITILAILSVIAMQAVGGMIAKARVQADVENGQAIGSAIATTYANGGIATFTTATTAPGDTLNGTNTFDAQFIGNGKALAMLPPIKAAASGYSWRALCTSNGTIEVYLSNGTNNLKMYPKDTSTWSGVEPYASHTGN